jgi:hypothetical protein
MSISESSAALPLVGKRLDPLGSITAMVLWASRQAPELTSSAVRSKFASGETEVLEQDPPRADEVSVAALRGIVSAERLDVEWPGLDRELPVLRYAKSVGNTCTDRLSVTAARSRSCPSIATQSLRPSRCTKAARPRSW